MVEPTSTPARLAGSRLLRLQAQDFAWLIFVAALILTKPETNYNYTILVVVIAAFQILEPRITLFSSKRGQLASVALKFILSYLLVGWSHGVESSYYSIFLIPVVSAAAIYELPGVIVATAIACACYFSFLLPIYIDWARFDPPSDYLDLMGLRASFFAIIAFLVYQQAQAKREEMRRTEEANRELRQAQASLRRSERLAALGQLTAGLAHELRNPLGTIRASAEMLHRRSAKSNPQVMEEMASNITSEVDRMNGLVASFLDFARPLELHPAREALRTVFDEALRDQAELATSRGVRVVAEGAESIPQFPFDRNLLRVALSNLLQNAIQASASGQEVQLTAQRNEEDVVILVRDFGEGIAREHLESIFNPFFTTKPKGVGLGLALVAKIIDEHGGRVHVTREHGRGTMYEISVPQKEVNLI